MTSLRRRIEVISLVFMVFFYLISQYFYLDLVSIHYILISIHRPRTRKREESNEKKCIWPSFKDKELNYGT